MSNNPKMTLVIGGRRSGKSTFAEGLVSNPRACYYIATAAYQPDDQEMVTRITQHRQRRPKTWHTIEEAYELPQILLQYRQPETFLLVDCLSLWISNLLLADYDISQKIAELEQVLINHPANLIFVSSEVGLSIVPDNKLGRTYADLLGTLNQQLAKIATEVFFIVAGLAHQMKTAKL